MAGVQGRGSRFAGVENRVLQRLTHDEASARVQSTVGERSLQHAGRIIGGAESVPPLDRTACGPDLPLRVSRRSRSLAILHSRHDAAERSEPIDSVLSVARVAAVKACRGGGAMRPGRSVSAKNAPQAVRAAFAGIRHGSGCPPGRRP